MGGGRAFGLRLFDDDDADDAAGEVERGGNCSDGRGYGGGGDRIWDPGSEEACSDGGGGAVGINLSDGGGKVELQYQPFLCSEKKAKLQRCNKQSIVGFFSSEAGSKNGRPRDNTCTYLYNLNLVENH